MTDEQTQATKAADDAFCKHLRKLEDLPPGWKRDQAFALFISQFIAASGFPRAAELHASIMRRISPKPKLSRFQRIRRALFAKDGEG